MGGVDLTYVLIAFSVLIVSLTFHEAAHAWAANQLGDPTARQLGRLSLNPVVHVDPIGTILFPLIALFTGVPLIGWAKPVPVDMRFLKQPRRDFALVALAGPVSNLILAVLGAIALRTVIAGEGTERVGSLLLEGVFLFVVLNVLLAVFNMIPIPPLDGGNVLLGILPPQLAVMVERIRPWGFLLLYALLLSGFLGAITRPIQRMIINWIM